MFESESTVQPANVLPALQLVSGVKSFVSHLPPEKKDAFMHVHAASPLYGLAKACNIALDGITIGESDVRALVELILSKLPQEYQVTASTLVPLIKFDSVAKSLSDLLGGLNSQLALVAKEDMVE